MGLNSKNITTTTTTQSVIIKTTLVMVALFILVVGAVGLSGVNYRWRTKIFRNIADSGIRKFCKYISSVFGIGDEIQLIVIFKFLTFGFIGVDIKKHQQKKFQSKKCNKKCFKWKCNSTNILAKK